MPMERSQHKVAAGIGTGAWPGDTLREQEAPKPVLWKEEQKVKRREPWHLRHGSLRRHLSCTLGSHEEQAPASCPWTTLYKNHGAAKKAHT